MSKKFDSLTTWKVKQSLEARWGIVTEAEPQAKETDSKSTIKDYGLELPHSLLRNLADHPPIGPTNSIIRCPRRRQFPAPQQSVKSEKIIVIEDME